MALVVRFFRHLIFLWLCCGFTAAAAQSASVVVLDSNLLYERSKYGQSLRQGINEERRILETEFSEIIQILEREEQQLAEARQNLSREEFAEAAAAFDQRVQEVRREQDERVRQSYQSEEQNRDTFFKSTQPIIIEILTERNAAVLLEKSQVVLTNPRFDITQTAIARIDAFFLNSENTTNN